MHYVHVGAEYFLNLSCIFNISILMWFLNISCSFKVENHSALSLQKKNVWKSWYHNQTSKKILPKYVDVHCLLFTSNLSFLLIFSYIHYIMKKKKIGEWIICLFVSVWIIWIFSALHRFRFLHCETLLKLGKIRKTLKFLS